jgi:hypothetical protein
MSDIQRWGIYQTPGGFHMAEYDKGKYVTYEDAVAWKDAAVAVARAEERKRIRKAVNMLAWIPLHGGKAVWRKEVIAVIEGKRGRA